MSAKNGFELSVSSEELSERSNPIPFNRPSTVGDEERYLRDAIERGKLSGDGHYTKKCNEIIAQLTGASAALLTHSCTAALEMAAILCELEPGDEVIMPSFTFVSTANAVALRGAVPVFVDIDREFLNIDPAKAAAAVTDRTKAIFVVHYAGFPCDMDALQAICDEHGLLMVEDAAQALGSTYHGKPCGALGDMAAFSFHETKNIVSGEGGALTVNRENLVKRAEIIREKGTNRSQFFRGQVNKYEWMDIGSSYLPSELVAAFLLAQLEKVDRINGERLAIFERYRRAFEPLAASGRVILPKALPNTTGNGHMFFLRLRDLDDRSAFIAHMEEHRIGTPFHYIPLHSAPAGLKFGRSAGSLEVTDHVSETLVRLPVFFELGRDIDEVIECALAFFE